MKGWLGAPRPAVLGDDGVFDEADDAIAVQHEGTKAWEALTAAKERVIAVLCGGECECRDFARRELEETGIGPLEDKVAKQHNAANSTPGLEDLNSSWSGDKGLVVEEFAPYGVIAAVTPSTHPTPVLFNSPMMIIASGNTVVFNVHPGAKQSRRSLSPFQSCHPRQGGSQDFATMIRDPTLESADTISESLNTADRCDRRSGLVRPRLHPVKRWLLPVRGIPR